MLSCTTIPLKCKIFQTFPLSPWELVSDGSICPRNVVDHTASLPSALSLLPSRTWWETSPVRWQDGATSRRLSENTRPSLTLAGAPHALITAAPPCRGPSVCVCVRAAPTETTVRDAPQTINPVSIRDFCGGGPSSPPKGVLGWSRKTKILFFTLCKLTRKRSL